MTPRLMPLSKYALKKRLRLVKDRASIDLNVSMRDLDDMWLCQINAWAAARRPLPQTRAEWLAAELSFILSIENRHGDTCNRSQEAAE